MLLGGRDLLGWNSVGEAVIDHRDDGWGVPWTSVDGISDGAETGFHRADRMADELVGAPSGIATLMGRFIGNRPVGIAQNARSVDPCERATFFPLPAAEPERREGCYRPHAARLGVSLSHAH